MKKLLLITLLLPFLGYGQYSMDFSVVDTGVQALGSSCSSGSGDDVVDCDGYNPGSNWTMSHNAAGGAFTLDVTDDYMRVVSSGSIDAVDPDGPLCVDSPEINIAGLGTVTITVSVSQSGTFESSDDVDFTYTVDGTPTTLSVNDDFGTQTWTPTVSGNTLTLSVCLDCNSNTETMTITEVSTNLGSTVPIELLSFAATLNDKAQVELNWKTATEENNEYMAVERSADGKSFHEIGRVAGNGTTSDVRSYGFMDKEPFPGQNYYRLRQVDFDGTTSYHRVVLVNVRDKEPELEIFPNPVGQNSDILLRTAFEQEAQVEVYSLDGKLMHQSTLPAFDRNIEVPLAFLPAGFYVLKVTSRDQTVTEQFVKQ